MKQKLKVALGGIILVATVAAFAHYVSAHPALLDKLATTPPLLLVLLLGLYGLWFAALVLILRVSLRLFGKSMNRQENILLNAYSSLVNFFGPGQSGPVFRGLYLKKKHNLPVKNYIFATVLYYAFYAVISALFVCVGSRPWWQTVLAVIGVGGGCAVLVRIYASRSRITGNTGMNVRNLTLLFALTAGQLVVQAVIFYCELRSIDPSVSIAQALAYTGTANFAVFASVTPGAIGIREALLAFTQNLHGIELAVTVAANVIDRAVYLLLLGALFILTLSLHAKDKLRLGTQRP